MTEQDDDARQAQLDEAYQAGREAYRNYVRYAENPYRDPDLADQWSNGWLEAEELAHPSRDRI